MNRRTRSRDRLDRNAVWRARAVAILAALLVGAGVARAQQPQVPTSATAPTERPRPGRGPAAAVREGNRRLAERNPTKALEAYTEAQELAPEARAVAFDRGLAHFDLKEFDKAREAFDEATGTEGDGLSRDAQYSLGTCDHAEALEKANNPQASLGLLESAMRRYQSVLSQDQGHAPAREANRKAAAMWRELKQQLQQQPQQQSGGDDSQQDQQQNENQESDSNQKPEPQDAEQQQAAQQQNAEKKEAQDQKDSQSASAEDREEQENQQEADAAEPEEEVSREQAERRLREMMQTIRDRKRVRREQVPTAAIAPVEKDW